MRARSRAFISARLSVAVVGGLGTVASLGPGPLEEPGAHRFVGRPLAVLGSGGRSAPPDLPDGEVEQLQGTAEALLRSLMALARHLSIIP